MSRKLLIATDLSDSSVAALKFGAEQARATGLVTSITLVSIVEDTSAALMTFEFGLSPLVSGDTFTALESATRKKLAAMAEEHLKGLSVEIEIVRGTKPVAIELAEFVKANHYPALVLATHGRSGLSHFLMGSVAEEVVRQSACPTFVVPSRAGSQVTIANGGVPRILVLTDFSPEAAAVFPYASAEYSSFRALHPQMILLHVVEDILAASFHQTLGSDPDAIWSELESKAEAKMEEIRSRYFANDLVVSTVIRQNGSLGDEIAAFAKTRDVGLIVLGSHGRRGFQHAVLGSVAERLIRRSPCPVLVIPVPLGSAVE